MPTLAGIFENFVNDHVPAVDRAQQGRMMVAVKEAVRRVNPTWIATRVGSGPKHTSIVSSDIDVLVHCNEDVVTKPMRRRFREYLLEELRATTSEQESVEAVVFVKRIAVEAACGKASVDVVFDMYGKPLRPSADRPDPFRGKPNLQRAVRALKLLAHLRGDLCSLGPGYRYEALGLLAADTLGKDALDDRAGFLTFKTALSLVDAHLNDRLRPVCVSLGIDDDDITDIPAGKLQCWSNHSRSLLKMLDKAGAVTRTDDMRRIIAGSWVAPLPVEQTQTATPSANQPTPYLVARSANQFGSYAESSTMRTYQAQDAAATQEIGMSRNTALVGTAFAAAALAGLCRYLSSRSRRSSTSPDSRNDERGRRR